VREGGRLREGQISEGVITLSLCFRGGEERFNGREKYAERGVEGTVGRRFWSRPECSPSLKKKGEGPRDRGEVEESGAEEHIRQFGVLEGWGEIVFFI